MVNQKLEDHNRQLEIAIRLLENQVTLLKEVNNKKSAKNDMSLDSPNFVFKR